MLWYNEPGSCPLDINAGSSAWCKTLLKLISGHVKKLYFSFLVCFVDV